MAQERESAKATPARPVLRLSNVRKDFGPVAAVDGISFDVHEGEILTLLGPSGCGKSTTLRMVMGLERATGGTIEYDGRVVDSESSFVPPHKRAMGMVFQSYAVWPHMTVGKNVGYPLRLRRVPKRKVEEAVERTLALVGLEGMQDRPGTKLSGGQMQRVALARALIYEPKLLLLDEPFSNLDAQLREYMRAEVKSLQRRLGLTVLFVTHDQTEALSMSDSVVLLRAGNIVQAAGPRAIYHEPSDPFVRDFVGSTITLAGVVDEVTDEEATIVFPSGERVVGGVREGSAPLVGQRAEISIRPERIKLHRRADDAPGLRAEVKIVLFVGDRYEVQLRTEWGEEILTTVGGDQEWEEGDQVTLALPSSAARIWPLPEADEVSASDEVAAAQA